MTFFSKREAKPTRQSDTSRQRLGFDEAAWGTLTRYGKGPVIEVDITSIQRVSVLRARRTEVHYNVAAVARFGKLTLPCDIRRSEDHLIPFPDTVPPNVVEGWTRIVESVAGLAHLDGLYVSPDPNDTRYEEIVPALNISLPEAYYDLLFQAHMRSPDEHAGFRLRSFASEASQHVGIVEDWSWERFCDWCATPGKTASEWVVLAESVSTWEMRSFRPKPWP